MGARSSTPAFSWDEIREHKYLVAHGKVYDVLAFMHDYPHQHPPCITKKFGTDCSVDYDMHRQGKKVWDQYCIGRLSD